MKSHYLLLALFCLLWTSLQSTAAVIFQYHHVADDTPPSTSVTVDQFESHLNFLQQEQFQIWPLTKIVTYIEEKRDFPDRVAAITFDDAYLSVLENAAPRLKKLGWPFTLFVATDPVDQHHSHYLSWKQIRELIEMGANIGNHSVSHRHLVRVGEFKNRKAWQAWVKKEILNAQESIQKETGQANKLFAYPYGEYSKKLMPILDDLGFVGFGQQSGAVSSGSNLVALPRFPMNRKYASLESFANKAYSLGFQEAAIKPDYIVLDQYHLPKRSFDETLVDFEFHFYSEDVQVAQLACYASNAGKLPLTHLPSAEKQKHKMVTFSLPNKLPVMRSRVNCTAPSQSKSGQFYWFSHTWIKPLENGEWYTE